MAAVKALRLPRPLTLDAALERFAADLAAGNRSPQTVAWYYRHVLRFRRFVMARGLPDDVSQIRREHLRDVTHYFKNEYWAADADGKRTPRRLSATTVFGTVKAVRRFFSWLSREGLIPMDPTVNVTVPSPPREPKRAYTGDEIARMLTATSARRRATLAVRDRALIGFIAETGCRVSEGRTVLLADVDLEQRRARISGKGARVRVVPVSDGLAELLDAYLRDARPQLAGAEPHPGLFLSESGGELTLSAVEQLFRRLCRRAAVDPKGRGIHGLRRSFAVRWLNRGGDPYTLRLILGHRGLSMIAHHYAALLPEDVDDKFRRLGVSILVAPPAPAAVRDAPTTARSTKRTKRVNGRRVWHPTR